MVQTKSQGKGGEHIGSLRLEDYYYIHA